MTKCFFYFSFIVRSKEEKEKYETETTLPFPIKLYGKSTLRKLAKVTNKTFTEAVLNPKYVSRPSLSVL